MWNLSWHLYSVPLPGRYGSLLGMSCPWLTHSLAPLWHSYNLYPQQITSPSKYGIAAQRWSRTVQSIHLDMCSTKVLFSCALVLCHQPKNSCSPSCCGLPPIDQPCWRFCLAPPFPSKLLALTNSPSATIAPARFLPVCGHGYWGVKCFAHLSQNCSAAPLTAQRPVQAEPYPAVWLAPWKGLDVSTPGPNATNSPFSPLPGCKLLQIHESILHIIWKRIFFREKVNCKKKSVFT